MNKISILWKEQGDMISLTYEGLNGKMTGELLGILCYAIADIHNQGHGNTGLCTHGPQCKQETIAMAVKTLNALISDPTIPVNK